MFKNWVYLLVIILFSLLGMKALLHPGLFTAHDIWHQVVRFYYYSEAVNDGQFPPYWISQLANGFGYPLFFFSYHFPWIIGILLLKIGFDIPSSIKSLFILSYIFSGFTMYVFVKSLLKDRLSALLSSILYLWLPYHFLIIFVSGSMGIAFIFTFLPLILLGIHLSSEGIRFGPPIFALGLSGIILSHIMHLIFLSPLILIYLVWEFSSTNSKSRFIRKISLGVIVGLLISSFYLIPAGYYNQYTRVHKEEGIAKLYERNFVNFKQLIYSKWGFSPIVNNAKNGEISFQLGVAQWISIIGIIILMISRKLSKSLLKLSTLLLLTFITCILLMLDISMPLWKIIVGFISLDFPFRLLLPATFIASLCAGIVVVSLKRKIKFTIFLLISLINLYTNRNHINVNEYTYFPISTYLDLETEITTNTFNEYLPIQANPRLLNKPWNEITGKNLSAAGVRKTTNLLSFNVKTGQQQTVSLGQFYFPGQTVYVDNTLTQFESDEQGRISLKMPKGNHTVLIKFQNTPLMDISIFLSMAGILTIFFLIFKKPALNDSYFMKLVYKYNPKGF